MEVYKIPNGKKTKQSKNEEGCEEGPGNEKEPKQVQHMPVFQNTPFRGLNFAVVNFEQKTLTGIPSCFT